MASFPAYAGAEIVGVRAEYVASLLSQMSQDERDRLVTMFRSGTPIDDYQDSPDEGTPSDEGPADQDPLPAAAIADFESKMRAAQAHSPRSRRAELQAQRARFIISHGR